MLKKIAKNTAFLAVGRFTGEGINLILFVTLSRLYGEADIGKYGFALAIATILGAFADFGYSEYAVKVFSQDRIRAKSFLSNFLILRVFLTGMAGLVLAGLSFSIDVPETTCTIIVLIGVYQLIFSFAQIFIAEIKAHEEMSVIVSLEFIHRGSILSAALLFIAGGSDFVTVMSAFPVGSLIYLIAALYSSQRRYGRIQWRFDWTESIRSLAEAGHFFLANLFVELYFRSPLLFLAFMIGEEAAGSYTMASKLVIILGLLSYFFSSALYPAMSKLFKDDRAHLTRLSYKSLQYLLISMIPMMIGLAFFSGEISSLIFGNVSPVVPQLIRLLSFYLGVLSLTNFLRYFLFSTDQQRRISPIQIIATGVNVALSVVFIKFFGIVGAAFAVTIAEISMALMFMRYVPKELITGFGGGLIAKPVFAGFAALAVLFFLHRLSDFVAVAVSVAVYLSMLFFIKAISVSDLNAFKQLFPRSSSKEAVS